MVDGLRFEQHDPRLFLCTRLVFQVGTTIMLLAGRAGWGESTLEHEVVVVVVGMPHKNPRLFLRQNVLTVPHRVAVVVNQVPCRTRSIGSVRSVGSSWSKIPREHKEELVFVVVGNVAHTKSSLIGPSQLLKLSPDRSKRATTGHRGCREWSSIRSNLEAWSIARLVMHVETTKSTAPPRFVASGPMLEVLPRQPRRSGCSFVWEQSARRLEVDK